jgi:3',5'-cyclic AMP phosphodiesterase CpdA
VTVLVVSDTHFGYAGIETVHEKAITAMNTIAGTPHPASIGGAVGAPRGLVITGDLTEWGTTAEWERFLVFYRGPDARLRLPVFEMAGNHDADPGPYVRERVAERHGAQPYAWDWDDLHLVAFGEAPNDGGLAFLAADLAKLERDVPLVLFMHFPLEGPWSTGNWFGDGPYRERLARLLEGRNVVGIFHGHHHQRGHYVWHGIDVVKPGAVKNEERYFTVVHVTDAGKSILWRDYREGKWLSESVVRAAK